MKWVEFSVETVGEFVEPLSQVFIRYGSGGVLVESPGGHNPDEGESPPDGPVVLKTYAPLDGTRRERRERIDVGVRLVGRVGPVTALQERVLEEREWQDAWKEHFHALRVGERLVVAPGWREYEPGPSDVVVRLDPGMAFGTGHHPTTRACLELLEALTPQGARVLDVGCGSGILGIAAVKLGASSAFGLDVDAAAVRTARANAADNGVSGSVEAAEGTLPHAGAPDGAFDVVLANISSKVVSELAPHLARAAAPGGVVVASGLIEGKSAAAEAALAAAGMMPQERRAGGDWVTLACRAA